MRNTKNLLLGLAITGLFTACTNADRSEIKEEAQEVTGQTQPDINERKTSFIDESSQRIDQIASDLQRLEAAKLKNPTDENQEKAQESLGEAKDALETVRNDLKDLRDTSADEWEDERSDFTSNMNKLEEHFSTARTYYE